jgi:hypothetical protein
MTSKIQQCQKGSVDPVIVQSHSFLWLTSASAAAHAIAIALSAAVIGTDSSPFVHHLPREGLGSTSLTKRRPSRLPGATEQPLTAQLSVDLFVRNRTTGIFIGFAASDGLYDVKMVLDVFKAAIVGKAIQERTHGIFGCHQERPGL